MRKAITKEAFWDILKESGFEIDQKEKNKILARVTRIPLGGPRSMMSTYDQTVMARPTKLAAAKGTKPRDEDVMARTSKLPKKVQSKPKEQDVMIPTNISGTGTVEVQLSGLHKSSSKRTPVKILRSF